MAGFTTLNVEPFTLEVGQTRTLNANLSVGAVTAKTTVEASAAGLDESSAEIGGVSESQGAVSERRCALHQSLWRNRTIAKGIGGVAA